MFRYLCKVVWSFIKRFVLLGCAFVVYIVIYLVGFVRYISWYKRIMVGKKEKCKCDYDGLEGHLDFSKSIDCRGKRNVF